MASFNPNGTLTLDQGSVENRHVSGTVGNEILADKLQPYFAPCTNLGFAIGATPTTREEIVHVCKYAGVIRGFHALLNDTGTTTSITFDLKKNGTTVLSAVATITHSDADRLVKDGPLSGGSVAVVAGDVLSVLMTVTSSTGAQGPHAWASLTETRLSGT